MVAKLLFFLSRLAAASAVNASQEELYELWNRSLPLLLPANSTELPAESNSSDLPVPPAKANASELPEKAEPPQEAAIPLPEEAEYAEDPLDELMPTSDGFQQFLFKIRYDHRERPRPFGEGFPCRVNVSIFVGSIRSVSEATMDYSLEMFYREYWRDPRLAWDPINFENRTEVTLHESYADFIWKPDTFLPSAIESTNPKAHSITHRSLLRLKLGGEILWSRRLSVKAECPMDLTMFPFDMQVCKLSIESYGYSTREITYQWKRGIIPVQVNDKIRLPDFILKSVITKEKNYSYETGTYSRLYACFQFQRSAGFCFLQLIIPATAVVITSWISLWMENETSFQDMIAVILTITFLIFSYNTVMPRVSYIKAMDVYLGACFFFVFMALIKLAIVKYMRQRLQVTRDTSLTAMNGGSLPVLAYQKSGERSPSLRPERDEKGRVINPRSVSKHLRNQHFRQMCMWKFLKWIHLLSQILFPCGFIAFCIFYFAIYPNLYQSDITDSDCV